MNVNVGKGIELDVDVARLGLAVVADTVASHVVYIGLRNILMDSHAGVTANSVVKNANGHVLSDAEHAAEIRAQSRSVVEKKLAALYAGEFRVASVRTRLDAVEAEARRMALAAVQEAVRTAGKKLSSYPTEWYAERVKANFEKFTKAAERVVAERAKSAVSLDLDGLGV